MRSYPLERCVLCKVRMTPASPGASVPAAVSAVCTWHTVPSIGSIGGAQFVLDALEPVFRPIMVACMHGKVHNYYHVYYIHVCTLVLNGGANSTLTCYCTRLQKAIAKFHSLCHSSYSSYQVHIYSQVAVLRSQ